MKLYFKGKYVERFLFFLKSLTYYIFHHYVLASLAGGSTKHVPSSENHDVHPPSPMLVDSSHQSGENRESKFVMLGNTQFALNPVYPSSIIAWQCFVLTLNRDISAVFSCRDIKIGIFHIKK